MSSKPLSRAQEFKYFKSQGDSNSVSLAMLRTKYSLQSATGWPESHLTSAAQP